MSNTSRVLSLETLNMKAIHIHKFASLSMPQVKAHMCVCYPEVVCLVCVTIFEHELRVLVCVG